MIVPGAEQNNGDRKEDGNEASPAEGVKSGEAAEAPEDDRLRSLVAPTLSPLKLGVTALCRELERCAESTQERYIEEETQADGETELDKRRPAPPIRARLLDDTPSQPLYRQQEKSPATGAQRGEATHKALSMLPLEGWRIVEYGLAAAKGEALARGSDTIVPGHTGPCASENDIVAHRAVTGAEATNSVAAKVEQGSSANSTAAESSSTAGESTSGDGAAICADHGAKANLVTGGDDVANDNVCHALDALVSQGVLSPTERALCDAAQLTGFLNSPLGRRMRQSDDVRREWSFNARFPALSEAVVQGVIDLCFAEDGAWVLVDYKTDRVTDAGVLLPRYGRQLALYREALRRITGREVKETWLYSLRLGAAVAVPEGDVSRETMAWTAV